MSDKRRILELLASAQPDTVTNAEMNEIGFRFGARIDELRHEGGFDIPPAEHAGGGLRRYRLLTPKKLIDWDRLEVILPPLIQADIFENRRGCYGMEKQRTVQTSG